MDKLELDARVAQLDRRIALLSLLIPVAVAGVALMMIFNIRSQSDASMGSATVVPPPMEGPVPPLPPRPVAVSQLEDGSAAMVAAQLEDLSDLYRKSIIMSSDFQAKKNQLLEKPIKVKDLKTDLERFAELQRRNVISTSEYQQVKKQVLGLDN